MRFPLSAKVLLWFFINLAFLGAAGWIFARGQLRLGLDSLLAGPVNERLQAMGVVLSAQLNERPRGRLGADHAEHRRRPTTCRWRSTAMMDGRWPALGTCPRKSASGCSISRDPRTKVGPPGDEAAAWRTDRPPSRGASRRPPPADGPRGRPPPGADPPPRPPPTACPPGRLSQDAGPHHHAELVLGAHSDARRGSAERARRPRPPSSWRRIHCAAAACFSTIGPG